MKYIFILGRNITLSIAEIFSYFEKEKNKILNYSQRENALLIDLEKKLPKNILEDFGGVIAIGEIIASENSKNISNELEKKQIYFGEKNKLNYVLWDFAEDSSTEQVTSYLKKRFRKEKLKATKKPIRESMFLQEGGIAKNISSSSLIDEQYLIFQEKDILYFSKIIEKCNYEKLEKRDMGKPVRRESLSISPRLSKIMINLSQVKKNQKLIDPFCGIGVILFEALLQDIKVIGTDRDKKAIGGARRNLEWANFEKSNYQLIRKDSSKVKIENVNALVTEPDLGETLKKIPTKNQAKKTMHEFENLMISVLNNLNKKISGKIVFTAPLIKTISKRMSCNIEKILEETNLKLSKVNNIQFPIQEFRKNQIVGRDIFVLEK